MQPDRIHMRVGPMNPIAIIILSVLLLELLLNFIADALNLKHLQTELPDEFQEHYDPHRYRRSQSYLKVHTRFAWVVSVVQLALLLGFWFAKGFPLLDAWIRSWQLGPVLSGVFYIGILAGLAGLVSLPFSIYSTFVIEERFGFNQTTGSTFIKDRLKGVMLAVVIGTPLLVIILTFFQYAGSHAWMFCWLAVTFYLFGVQLVAPTWIMPLFNRFVPLEDGPLKDAILRYAASIKFPLENVFVMDGSRRTRKSNAFFTGFGRRKRIVLFDTLITNHGIPELVSVLAHEMGHYKQKHIWISLAVGILQTGLMLYLLSLFLTYPGLFEAFYVPRPSVYAGLIFFALLYTPLDFLIGLWTRRLSRKHEYAADRFSALTTGNPQAMIEALKKLSVHNLSNLTPHPFYVFLNYSHPPVLARIRRLKEAA
jgi:STE24 endopeptidase